MIRLHSLRLEPSPIGKPHRIAQVERRPLQTNSRATVPNKPAQSRGECHTTNLPHLEFYTRANQPLTASPFRTAPANRSASLTTASRPTSVSPGHSAANRPRSESASTPIAKYSASGVPFPLVGASECALSRPAGPVRRGWALGRGRASRPPSSGGDRRRSRRRS